MPLQIVRNDITKMKVDAIVNAANTSLLGGGGVDGAIHRAAGPKLLAECRKLNGCPTGDAKMTKGYRLKAKYIIHTVGPIYRDGHHQEEKLLRSCYQKSLALALEKDCDSIAFPLISAGAYGYPKDQALQIAIEEISHFLLEHDMMVYLVIFDLKAFQISAKLFAHIQSYIDDHYVISHSDAVSSLRRNRKALLDEPPVMEGTVYYEALNLEDALKQMDESFSEMLMRKIDEAGMKDSECYKKANVDRKLFSKIRSHKNYKPSKKTVLAFAIALELPLDETNDMLKKAGYALSHSNKFDIIVEYFIIHKHYDIYEINEALFAFDQPLLGG
ncbi:O-acetyl-ADP-ribose deacetylase [Intestinibaculum porci]|uniref:O-acetyl-ADP-ribose deacetylase n=1 Tax=Intestinibaculum porci TaxID=2487118 RepID=UPI002409CE05|nr:O-acetyl-ADP-ribose deacetylase [Intestinibaculum porci]MDD6350267.1 O-acetyl-ADP-ribose deacetylase [Intestinibaculum porci]